MDGGHQRKAAILRRLLLIYFFFGLWGIALAFRLVQLQTFRGEDYRRQAEEQQRAFAELLPRRGEILDRNLAELAISVQTQSVFAHPQQISDPFGVAQTIAPILEEPFESLYTRLSSEKSFVYLKRKVTPRQAQQLRELDLNGIYTHQEGQRVYPNRRLAAHVLGFVGMDNEGLAGLEYRFDEQLGGQQGRIMLQVDARRQSFHRRPAVQKSDGQTLVLTLEKSIQHTAEQVLEETMLRKKAKSGSALVMNPHNGEILAMASYPAFNPNNYGEFTASARRNRPVLEIYEPGSTFKLITLAAVLNEGLVQPDEVIDCRVGTVRLAGKVYKEAKYSYEDLTFNQILAKSSNVGTIKLGLRLGEEALYDYIQRFGFDQRTGIELPGEERGILRPTSQWSRISIGAISIGQEISVTPLQMIRAVAALANGGYLVKPHLVQRILTPDGDVVYQSQPERRQILSGETVQKMKSALALVMEEGTGRGSRLNGYSSAGKTGTAQKIVSGRYSKSLYVASFAGFAPVDDPALVTLVVINEPGGLYYGAHAAGPAFKEIMERSLIHLKVPRDQPMPLTGSPLEMASGEEKESELQADKSISEREETWLGQLEENVLSILEDEPDGQGEPEDVITVSLDAPVLPDFTGKSLRMVARECGALGVRVKIRGSGTAVGQRPLAGSPLYPGMVCEVFFSEKSQSPRNRDEDATSEIVFQDSTNTSAQGFREH